MKREEALACSEAALRELAQDLAQGQSDTLRQYLDTMATFHRYSFGNTLLIAAQCPRATVVAGYHAWRQKGRWVKQGEKGIAILAPMLIKKRQVKSCDDKDPEPAQRTIAGFRVVHVYDVSQTDGRELAEFAAVTGDPGERLIRLEDFVHGEGIVLQYVDFLGGALGVSQGGTIQVLTGLSQADTFAVLVHETAHELLHRGDRRTQTTKCVRETEAEAVAYVVSRAIGLDCSTKCADYIQLYAGDEHVLLQSLELVRNVASRIICALEESSAEQMVTERHDSVDSPTAAMPSAGHSKRKWSTNMNRHTIGGRYTMHDIHPIIKQIIDRDCHVSLTGREDVRHVISKLRDGYAAFRRLAKVDRLRFIRDCLAQHRENVQLYLEVMSGHSG